MIIVTTLIRQGEKGFTLALARCFHREGGEREVQAREVIHRTSPGGEKGRDWKMQLQTPTAALSAAATKATMSLLTCSKAKGGKVTSLSNSRAFMKDARICICSNTKAAISQAEESGRGSFGQKAQNSPPFSQPT